LLYQSAQPWACSSGVSASCRDKIKNLDVLSYISVYVIVVVLLHNDIKVRHIGNRMLTRAVVPVTRNIVRKCHNVPVKFTENPIPRDQQVDIPHQDSCNLFDRILGTVHRHRLPAEKGSKLIVAPNSAHT
uniref:Tick transposon n=1 Tax=Nippostrongylus brasiliensis TaxID=27835 RepID=A0A0N4XKD2_NIPBR